MRAPARVGEIAKIAAVDPGEVIAVADAFRRADRCFLAVPEGPLDENTLLDLSHESLIRQWRRLAGWATDEARSAEMYRRLRDWALRWEQGNAELWRGPDLASAASWREREAPNEAWAERYGDRRAISPCNEIPRCQRGSKRAAAAAEEQKRQQQLKRVKRLAWGFGGATADFGCGNSFLLGAYVWDHVTYYKEIVESLWRAQGYRTAEYGRIAHRSASYRFIY